ncbi:hypothetical protein JL720_769 [Aureococcus anophagefferens]|nr:hypothetical protein JL720_769 [Aureococcus anophagefferens]
MDSTEFFGMLGEDRTPLTDALFGLMDLDGSGTIEFDEFVAVLLTYCMYSKDDILRFCFDTYDRDHSNSIDEQEFMALLSSVNNGTPMFPGNFTTVLQNFDSNDDGIIDFQEFKVNRQRFKNEHRRTHGRDPPVSIAECVVSLVLCRRNHEIDIDVIDSKKPSITSAQQAADKKKAILEGANRKKRPSRASFDDEAPRALVSTRRSLSSASSSSAAGSPARVEITTVVGGARSS